MGFNLIFFPFTVLLNLFHYLKWIRLLHRLGLDETILAEKVSIRVTHEKMSLSESFKRYGEIQNMLPRMNAGHVLVRDNIYIFPTLNPNGREAFFTEIQDPVIIGLTNSKHPFETLWKTPTFTEIDRIVVDGGKTDIYLTGEIYEFHSRLRIYQELSIPPLIRPKWDEGFSY